jgi:hypothetical protein
MNPSQILESAEVLCSMGSPDSVRASMHLVKASADLAQAEMIKTFERAQNDIIKELARLTNNDLATYHVEAALMRVTITLGKLKGTIEPLAETLVKANVIIGKLRGRFGMAPADFVTAFDLAEPETKRVEMVVNQMLGQINHAVDNARQSVRNQVQAACVSAQSSKENQGQVEVNFPSIEAQGEDVTSSFAKPEKKLTEKEKAELVKNPTKEAKKISNDAYKQIQYMRNMYVIGRREADIVRQQTLRSVALQEATGSGMVNAQKNLITSLMNEGLVAFIDRGGHRWTLGNYCNMAVRTTSAQASNLGEIFDDPEQDLYIIVDRKSTCPICAKYEGRVYSRSGTNPNYPPLKDAFSKIDPNGTDEIENTYLSIHPNCRHTIAKFVEKAHTPEQIEAYRKFSNPLTNPYSNDQRSQAEVKRYKERERVMGLEAASEREYRKLMQYIPVSELGSWITFHKHFLKKDDKYKKLLEKYRNAVQNSK